MLSAVVDWTRWKEKQEKKTRATSSKSLSLYRFTSDEALSLD